MIPSCRAVFMVSKLSSNVGRYNFRLLDISSDVLTARHRTLGQMSMADTATRQETERVAATQNVISLRGEATSKVVPGKAATFVTREASILATEITTATPTATILRRDATSATTSLPKTTATIVEPPCSLLHYYRRSYTTAPPLHRCRRHFTTAVPPAGGAIYEQGQSPGPGLREYFYYIDHQGMVGVVLYSIPEL